MRSFKLKVAVTILSLLSFGLTGWEVQAAGPAVAQQSMLQAQSAVTEASLGWHRGWGWGGPRFGWGGPRFGWGGWGYRGWGGWGFGGFRGYGFGPAWGYGGFTYVRPVIYTYPAYSYPIYYSTPSYCCGYSYVSPYQSSYYCASNTTTPISYSVASYDYPAQPVSYASNTVSTPRVYSSPTSVEPAYVAKTFRGQSANTSLSSLSAASSNSGVYTPRKQSVATASNLAIYRTALQTSNRVPVAPLPNPPVAYAKQESVRSRIAKTTASKLHQEYLAAAANAESKIGVASNSTVSTPEEVTADSAGSFASYTPASLNSYSAVARFASDSFSAK